MTSFTKESITVEAAGKAIEAAVAKAGEIGTGISVAIVDEGGNLKAFHRTDDASLISSGIAQDKAYTAAAFGWPTHGIHDFIKDDPQLSNGMVHVPRVIVFGGGYPITSNGKVIGAIGISGGHYSQDMQCAEAGLGVLGIS